MIENKFINNLWSRYQQTKDIDIRNLLVEKHLSIVTYCANVMFKKLPSQVQYDDLYSDGVLGLIQAVEKFDLDKNIQFITFASYRVFGMIKDGLRNRNHVPRLIRQRNKDFIDKVNSIQQELGYIPHEEEVRKRMQYNYSEFIEQERLRGRIRKIESLSKVLFTEDGRNVTLGDCIEDNNNYDIITLKLQKKEFSTCRLLEGLSREKKLILILYYRDGLTFKEIGSVIGISEGRVFQIHLLLLEYLRGKLEYK